MIKDSDAHKFVDILKKRKKVDLGFYYAYELDEENRLKNVFGVNPCVGGPMHCLRTCYLSTQSIRLIGMAWCLLRLRHQPSSPTHLLWCGVDTR